MKKTNENISSHRIDDYLLQLEKQEKTKRRRKGMLIILLGGMIATGFVVAKFLLSDRTLPMYAFDDLDTDFLVQLQENDQLPILVNHPNLGIDTIASIADYTDLLNLSYSITSNQSLKVSDNSPIEQDSEDNDNPELPLFALDIVGKREKDPKLRFIVENFSEEVDYQIDFGNGYHTTMGESVNYSYPRSGKYQVKLISTKGGQTSIYTKRIDIQSGDLQMIVEEIKPANTDAKVEVAPQNQANHQKTNETPDSIEENSLEGIASNRRSTDQLEIEDLQTAPIEKLPVKKITNPQEKAVTPSAEKQNNNPNNAEKQSAILSKPEKQVPVAFAQLMPEFPGGPGAFSRFILKNYRYPQKAKNYGVEGVVYVRFIVNPDGGLSEPHVIKGIGHGCDEEAIRLVSKMPKWIPGENGGVKVAVYQTIPVTFRLTD